MRKKTPTLELALEAAASSADLSHEHAAVLLAEHNRLVRERTGAKAHWKGKATTK